MKMEEQFWAMKEKSMKSAILNFLSLFPTRDHMPSPLDKGLYFAVIDETGKLEFTPEIVNGWDTWKSLPQRVCEKGKRYMYSAKHNL